MPHQNPTRFFFNPRNYFIRWFSILCPALLAMVVTYLLFLKNIENSAYDENSHTLPDACGNFSVIHGNWLKALVIVMGEDHSLSTQTFACMGALLTALNIKNYNFYYEGPTVSSRNNIWNNSRSNQDHKKTFIENSILCQSWDDQKIANEIQKALIIRGKINAIADLASSGVDDDAIYSYLYQHFLPTTFKQLKNDHSLIAAELLQLGASMEMAIELMKIYERFLAEKPPQFTEKNFFKKILNDSLGLLRAKTPSLCHTVTINPKDLIACIDHYILYNPARDQSLKNHIEIESGYKDGKNDHVSFFVAGAIHTHTIHPADEVALIRDRFYAGILD